MSRKVPVLPTLVVLAAVAVMIALGVWQGFYRLPQKEALAARYDQALTMSADAALPRERAAREQVWFRHTTFDCYAKGRTRPMAGHNRTGETGWGHWAQCPNEAGGVIEVNVGWSRTPAPVDYSVGAVSGFIAPDGPDGTARVVADLPLDGLEASARPDPRNIPNNHLSYAVQWFLFAATALVIYALALRKRLADKRPRG